MTVWRMSSAVDLRRHQPDGQPSRRIKPEDTERQARTASEILTRLRNRPGQILADEVGLGKTYTALAVAASVVIENPSAGPVVVMVPPSLREKWPVEWGVFRSLYLSHNDLRHAEARDGLSFLRLLDDREAVRAQLVFLTHGAFRAQMRDPWVKLALLRQVLLRRRGFDRERAAIRKFGFSVVGEDRLEQRRSGLAGILLDTPVSGWRGVLRAWGEDPGDDPVPRALLDAIPQIDAEPLLASLHGLPTNWSPNAHRKLSAVATALNSVIRELWQVWLGQARFSSPLLILDEAHHAKNRLTQLASLFANEADREPGALLSRFERMLFLTATPFQLGHRELLEVLDRFGAVDWSTMPSTRQAFEHEIRSLGQKLEAAQRATTRLDSRWGRLRTEDIPERHTWWLANGSRDDSPRLLQAQRAYADADRTMRAAENALQPWIIRHRKPETYPDGTPRRKILRGAQIIEERFSGGLDIATGELLPFLLAGRAQVAFRRAQAQGHLPRGARALFADGLCSSFEAYRDTRSTDALDQEAEPTSTTSQPEVTWYLNAISAALPRDGRRTLHPKVEPTVKKALSLWEAGDKVVIFCHFRKTGRALRRDVSAAIDAWLRQRAARDFHVKPAAVPRTLERLSERLYIRREQSPRLARAAKEQLDEIVAISKKTTVAEREDLSDRFLRYLRSPVTLARYGAPLTIGGPTAVRQMLDHTQAGGVTLRERLVLFVEFFDGRTEQERAELLDALGRVQSGRYHARRSEMDGEDIDTSEPALLPTVRLANGAVRPDARRRLLLAFNSPLLPEVLVASSVLAEGVDLHLECRHVIHHDLDWSPSTLEQRTGRIDRISSLAERTGSPVTVFLPYLAATQDEKMYRVVRDRERWFQVVMGARHELDETALDQIASRVELPDVAARALAFDLGIDDGASGPPRASDRSVGS
jgi:Helicase conserved C-terminal domain/SNF2-related domain